MPDNKTKTHRQALLEDTAEYTPAVAAYLAIDKKGNIVSDSLAATELLSEVPGAIILGHSLFSFFVEPVPIAEHYSPPAVFTEFEVRLKRANASHRWLNVSIFPCEGNGGKISNLVVLKEITGRTKNDADAKSLEAHKNYWMLFEATSDAILLENFDGAIFDCNSASERIYGYSRDELLCMNARDLVPGDFIAVIESLNPELENAKNNGTSIHIEGVGKRKDGSIFPAEVVIGFVEIAGEDCFAVTVRDISFRREIENARQRYENQLLQLQKLDNLGQMASGLANDFNNLLTGIMGYADLLLRELPTNNAAGEKARRIIDAARKASEIIQQLMAYTGKLPSLFQKTDLASLVKETRTDILQMLPENIELALDYDEGLPEINADPPMIKQAVLNIVKNSVDAIGDRPNGKISISILPGERSFYGNETGYFGLPFKKGSYTVVKFVDNGAGIAPAHLSKIFDPFFTTRYAGRGLGLSAVLGMLRGHRGAVYVSSTPGEGTEFSILLPFNVDCADGNFCSNRPPDEKFPAGTALLIDDDANVRDILAHHLNDLGYETFQAENGRRGLELFKNLNHRLNIVLIDIVLPDFCGTELFREIHWLNPEIPILACTGLLVDSKKSELEGLGVAGFLEKPFTSRELEKIFMRIQMKTRKRSKVS
ncbi:MAG: PAS domain S-box protein [Erysipelotrichia bacterium]|nr:PAS domain S-box protein [Erysipelotrichia bacterium]